MYIADTDTPPTSIAEMLTNHFWHIMGRNEETMEASSNETL
ncbi:hypothetical protein CSC32_2170 [Pseudomonas aeruginosa]|uniref:Uncharacterized protein n=1 Tax=Pseudomonas paraeruginosa TaxID=2994495 RepID=A0A2R3IT86_9PSED|nr:hypothetical protein CSB93_3147 [Pseudomonas paraeruginosa]AWE69594.1 hypothetical protein CSC32_2170 [Pseudomonas aeruginosa]AWE93746.1 hypothetical protein CSC28_1922 [Pseudomonas paraeruginosa]RCG87877.1 hypothetical protein CSB86_2559 [Pseudomonas aeruginosa]